VSRKWFPGLTPSRTEPVDLDTGVPHPARIYDYILGGKDNFAPDQAAARAAMAANPYLVTAMRENRAAMRRAAAFLAGDRDIRQFLDIGTGLPTSPNLHEIVQAVVPDARVVYVDNDPIVLAHARALLTGSPQGITAYLDADLRDTDALLEQAEKTLDFSQPIAIMLLGVLHLISDKEDPWGIVAKLVDAVPSGSYLVITHPASDLLPETQGEASKRYNQNVATHQTLRTRAEVARFFDGLELLEPGIEQWHLWRPDPGDQPDTDLKSGHAGVARKP